MTNVNGEGIRDMVEQRKQQGAMPTVKRLLSQDAYKKRFEDVLGKRAPGFMASVINATNTNKNLASCDPYTVISSAAVAATLDLPIDNNLGFAYIVPYGGKAQFQLGYRGFIQLALRTGLYRKMNVSEVYEDEIESYNPITEEIYFTPVDQWEQREKGLTNKITGYYAFFELLNGFRKELYMTKAQITNHAKTYSKSFSNPKGRWKQDFHAMALKTVIKRLLSKWGIMSIEMQTAMKADQAVVKDLDLDGDAYDYPDGGEAEDYIDAEVTPVEDEEVGEPEPQQEPEPKPEQETPKEQKNQQQAQQKNSKGAQGSLDDTPDFAK